MKFYNQNLIIQLMENQLQILQFKIKTLQHLLNKKK